MRADRTGDGVRADGRKHAAVRRLGLSDGCSRSNRPIEAHLKVGGGAVACVGTPCVCFACGSSCLLLMHGRLPPYLCRVS
eukprot:7378424-Prymnesium_polylepis.1